MFHKVKSITAMPEYKLIVTFEDETIKEYDVKPLFDVWDTFDDLRTIPNLYYRVKVDKGGYGISWNDEIDLACNELWENGKPCLSLKAHHA